MSNDDAKEWVTIKVPKTVRDDAREDPRTYGEIMRAGIDRVDQDGESPPGVDEVSERLEGKFLSENQAKELMNTPQDELRDQLDRLESSASTIEERTGRIERTLEDMGARR